jgi:hypothetical protein
LFQLPILVIGAFGFYFFADQGIQVAASVAALMLVLRSAVVGTTAFRALKLSWIELLPDVGRGILLSSLCAITVKVTQTAVSGYQMPLLSLAASILTALSILLLLLFFRPQLLGVQSATMVVRFF